VALSEARHDVNPLGPMIHLRELERQAIQQLRPFRPDGDRTAMDMLRVVLKDR
jgi:hypothetical protein